MDEINEERERLGECHPLCVELQSNEYHFFSEFFPHSVLPAWKICLQNTNVLCLPRQPAFCLTGTMQSYIIEFERLPASGTDRCPPQQPAFCVAEPVFCLSNPFQT